jgi:hypothetical protein
VPIYSYALYRQCLWQADGLCTREPPGPGDLFLSEDVPCVRRPPRMECHTAATHLFTPRRIVTSGMHQGPNDAHFLSRPRERETDLNRSEIDHTITFDMLPFGVHAFPKCILLDFAHLICYIMHLLVDTVLQS